MCVCVCCVCVVCACVRVCVCVCTRANMHASMYVPIHASVCPFMRVCAIYILSGQVSDTRHSIRGREYGNEVGKRGTATVVSEKDCWVGWQTMMTNTLYTYA